MRQHARIEFAFFELARVPLGPEHVRVAEKLRVVHRRQPQRIHPHAAVVGMVVDAEHNRRIKFARVLAQLGEGGGECLDAKVHEIAEKWIGTVVALGRERRGQFDMLQRFETEASLALRAGIALHQILAEPRQSRRFVAHADGVIVEVQQIDVCLFDCVAHQFPQVFAHAGMAAIDPRAIVLVAVEDARLVRTPHKPVLRRGVFAEHGLVVDRAAENVDAHLQSGLVADFGEAFGCLHALPFRREAPALVKRDDGDVVTQAFQFARRVFALFLAQPFEQLVDLAVGAMAVSEGFPRPGDNDAFFNQPARRIEMWRRDGRFGV